MNSLQFIAFLRKSSFLWCFVLEASSRLLFLFLFYMFFFLVFYSVASPSSVLCTSLAGILHTSSLSFVADEGDIQYEANGRFCVNVWANENTTALLTMAGLVNSR